MIVFHIHLKKLNTISKKLVFPKIVNLVPKWYRYYSSENNYTHVIRRLRVGKLLRN